MTRSVIRDRNCTTYTYNVKDIQKKDMLVYICDILRSDGVTGHGLILTQPLESNDWPGVTKEIPYNPVAAEFSETYGDAALTCVTAIMEYNGQHIMLSYLPDSALFSVILPTDVEAGIDEIEKNIIPDMIDQNPKEEIEEN